MPTTESYSILTVNSVRKEDRDAVRSLFDRLVSDAELHIRENGPDQIVCWAEDAILWGGDDPDNPGPITELLAKLQRYMGESGSHALYRELRVMTTPEAENPEMPRIDYYAWILTKNGIFPWLSDVSLVDEIGKRVKDAEEVGNP